MTDQRPLFPTAARALRWIGRLLRRLARPLLLLLLALVIVHLTATVITGVMLKREVARIKARGEPLRPIDMVEKLPPRTPNAADIYRQAFNALRLSQQEREQVVAANADYLGVDDPKKLEGHVALARKVIAANDDYFRLLEKASRLPAVSFPVKWEDPINVLLPHYAKLRDAARLLVVRAKLNLMEGRVDAAAEDCATIFRIADHAGRDPVLLGCLVSYAIHQTGLQQLEEVLSAGDPSQAVCHQLLQQLSAIDNRARFARAMLGERAMGSAAFEQLLRLPADAAGVLDPEHPRRLVLPLRLYLTLGRPLLNLDELAYYRFMEEVIAAAALAYPQSKEGAEAACNTLDHLPVYRSLLSRQIMPVYTRAVECTETDTAVIGAGRLAVGLRLYRYQHGRYPASLDALAQPGEKLPLDPFVQKPYHYRTEGNGFAIWSVGPDLEDNHATEPEGTYRWATSSPGPEATKLHADLVFRVAR